MENKSSKQDKLQAESKSDFLKKFEMSSENDASEEEDDHVHVEGCCSCHSNIGE